MKFLQDIIAGDKAYYHNSDIKLLNIRKCWSELAIKNIWPLVKDNQKLAKYLPVDEMELGRYPDREWFWKVLATTLPDYAEKIHDQVTEGRNT